RNARLRDIDLGAIDLRSIAEPIAVLSPIALVVGWQEAVMTLVSALFVLQSWRARDFSWARQGWFAALLALWAYELVRTVVGHPTATGVLFALQWIHLPLYAAALAHWILPDEKSRNRLLLATGAALTFYALDCLLQYFSGRDLIGRPAWDNRLTSVSPKPGVGIQIAWLMAAPVLGYWQKDDRAFAIIFNVVCRGRVRFSAHCSADRAFAIFLGAVCLLAVLLSGDRMGLLIALAAVVLIALIAPGLRKPLAIALPAAVVVLGGILYLSPKMYHRDVETTAHVIADFESTHYGIIFGSALEIARDHPIFGVGMHNYERVCLEPQYGPEKVGPDQLPRCPGHPHNFYLQWLAEGGLVGFGLFVAFVALALRELVRWRRANRDNLIFYGLAASLALRFWPLTSGTSFFSSWAAAPLFLVLGWSLAYCAPRREAGEEPRGQTGLSSPAGHVSHASSVGV
ncbi:MAG: O-antigen ligase family protein, partial [Roseiarcus sp.]